MKILALALALFLPLPALATTQEDVLDATLLPGWRTESGSRMAALHLRLAPEWKTYWRSPGDSGIPPQFDWTGSENLASVRVHWPRPQLHDAGGTTSFGYWNDFVLPIELIARDPAQPVTLRARVALGVCLDICIPAALDLSATLTGDGAPDPAIKAALRDRPSTAAEAGLRRIACTVDPIADGLRVTATLDLPAQGGTEAVVFEPADATIWAAEASVQRDGNRLTAATDLVAASGAPFALDRSGLTLTVIAANGAVEVKGCPAP